MILLIVIQITVILQNTNIDILNLWLLLMPLIIITIKPSTSYHTAVVASTTATTPLLLLLSNNCMYYQYSYHWTASTTVTFWLNIIKIAFFFNFHYGYIAKTKKIKGTFKIVKPSKHYWKQMLVLWLILGTINLLIFNKDWEE